MSVATSLSDEWLTMEAHSGGRITLDADDVTKSRQEFEGLFENLKPMLPAPPASIKSIDVDINEGLRGRLYVPSNEHGRLPVGLYIHCGGWYTGSIEGEDFVCRKIADKSGIILLSPDYRLAPENPYPAGLDDCCSAWEYLHNNASRYGGDNTRKMLMGGSAGGNLAAAVGVKYASDPDLHAVGSVLACFPSCDPNVMPAQYRETAKSSSYHETPMINAKAVQRARDWYGCPNPSDPLYSPLLHENLGRLRQVHVIAPTADPTYPESLAFYQMCLGSGVKATLSEWTGLPHFFWIIPTFPKSAELLDSWCQKVVEMTDTKDRI